MIAQRHDCRSNSPFITNFFILLILTPFLGRVTHTHTEQPLFTSHPIQPGCAALQSRRFSCSTRYKDTSTLPAPSAFLRDHPNGFALVPQQDGDSNGPTRVCLTGPPVVSCGWDLYSLLLGICTVSVLILISHVTGPGRRDVQASSKARVSPGPVHLLGNYFVLTRKREKEKEEEEEWDREREHARWR